MYAANSTRAQHLHSQFSDEMVATLLSSGNLVLGNMSDDRDRQFADLSAQAIDQGAAIPDSHNGRSQQDYTAIFASLRSVFRIVLGL